MSEEKIEAAKAEVQCLLYAGFIKEVTHPQWLANIVMGCKKNEKWRMCTDFNDLNKCCPKDGEVVVKPPDSIWHNLDLPDNPINYLFYLRTSVGEWQTLRLDFIK
jgi:hypothetical protein